MDYKIDFNFMQTNCFWFEPQRLCKSPDGNGVCIPEAICPLLKGKEMDKDKDNHVPGTKWEFDQDVARVFDDMLQRSIPQYDVMRETVKDIALKYMKNNTAVIDVGCARGDAIGSLAHMFPKVDFFGLDVSEAMLDQARDKFKDQHNVAICHRDLKEGLNIGGKASVILAVLTVQFTPIEYRMQIIRDMFNQLFDGGCLIIVEKVLGESAEIDVLFRERYYALKGKNGYSKDDIDRKKLALEGVLVPITAKWNESMLRSAGFTQVDCFWRWMNFAGWVAIK
jgi:tRNA (cmo5U34)-methyltransferase